MKKAFLAAAISLAAASGAHAEWYTGMDPALLAGNGELILSIFDPVTQNAYAQDLGVTFNQIRAGYNGTIALDPAHLAVFAGNYSNIQYSVMGMSNRQYFDDTYAEGAMTDNGVIYSMTPGQTPWVTGVGPDNISGQAQIQNQFPFYQDSMNFGAGQSNGAAENPVFSVTAGGQGYSGGGQWVSYIEGNLNRDTTGINGQSMELWLKGYTQDDGFGPSLDLLLGTITLDLTGGNGTLSFASTGTEVPVPAAAWLLGSALLGLGGVARRRRA